MVLAIARRLPTALSKRKAFGNMVIHVGTKDIYARQSKVLKEHYQTVLDTARKATNPRIVISRPLLTYRNGCERFSRLFGLGVQSTVLVSWTTGHRFGSSRVSTGRTGFTLVV
ncbi:hypothetical protein NFI96_031980 [Prochilodus magdalenae]|nr:hypothetical protein NFI96_031980 [Prochilodus magdalenae]